MHILVSCPKSFQEVFYPNQSLITYASMRTESPWRDSDIDRKQLVFMTFNYQVHLS